MSDQISQLVAMTQGAQANPQVQLLNQMAQNQAQQQPYDENVGYANQYNTPLTPEDEAKYQAWGKQQAMIRPDHRNPALDTYDYDMRGFWKSGGQFAQNGHAGDEFKKPNHPTFSSFSKYATPEMPGGSWGKAPDGSWTFTPSQTNLKYHDAGDLQEYFATQEKGNRLVLPQPAAQPTAQPAAPAATQPQSKFDNIPTMTIRPSSATPSQPNNEMLFPNRGAGYNYPLSHDKNPQDWIGSVYFPNQSESTRMLGAVTQGMDVAKVQQDASRKGAGYKPPVILPDDGGV